MQTLLERALFVVAPPNYGKSTTLRSMFKDRRLGTGGVPPKSSKKRLPAYYWLSNKRRLYLRLTSPHEANETLKYFIKKTCGKMVGGRWCFAGPLQPNACNKMPDAVESVRAFVDAFAPERVRVALLSRNQYWEDIAMSFLPNRDITAELLRIPHVEVFCLDARRRGVNGLLLADLFDFT